MSVTVQKLVRIMNHTIYSLSLYYTVIPGVFKSSLRCTSSRVQVLSETGLSVVFVKGDRNLRLKLAVLLTSQWYYLITLLAAKQYYATEEPGQELDILYTHSLSSAGECLSAQ